MTPTTGAILLAHGSRSPGQRDVITEIAARAQEKDHSLWRPAFLNHHGPTLNEAAAELGTAGCTSVIVVPALLSHAFHAGVDVPAAIATITSSSPVTLAEPIGPDAQLFQVIAEHIDTARSDWPLNGRELTVVVCAAGTSDERARAVFITAAELWGSTRTDHRTVAAFIAGGEPDVQHAVLSEVQSGRSVVVVPFTLASGALTERAHVVARDAGAIEFLPPLGAADAVVSIVRARRAACVRV